MHQTIARRLVAEAIGTSFLLTAVVGSGIMAERLSGGNVALALLANTIATGAALLALILTFGPISGAHFNPIVSLSSAIQNDLDWLDAIFYLFAQTLGAISGVVLVNVMFGLSAISWSKHDRSGSLLMLSEFVASFGLVAVIISCVRRQQKFVSFAVAAYISAAYWFTPSTSFANPAVTIGRAMSDSFAGIAPRNVLGFIVAQLVGGLVATWLFSWLVPRREGTEQLD